MKLKQYALILLASLFIGFVLNPIGERVMLRVNYPIGSVWVQSHEPRYQIPDTLKVVGYYDSEPGVKMLIVNRTDSFWNGQECMETDHGLQRRYRRLTVTGILFENNRFVKRGPNQPGVMSISR